jgi:hypothetical protein
MAEFDQATVDKMVADVAPEKRDAFLQDFKARGHTIKGAAPAAPANESLLKRAGDSALPTAGWMAGAAEGAEVGASLGPFGAGAGAAIGAGLGAGAGRFATEGFKALSGSGKTTGQMAGDAAKEGKSAAIGEAIMRPAAALGGAAWNKFIAMHPEAKVAADKAISTAKQFGFKLMPSQETQSYLAGLVESVLKKTSGGGAVLARYEQMQNAGFAAAKERITKDLGRETEMDFGGGLKDALSKSNDAITQKANDLLKKGQLSKEAYDKALTQHERRLAKVAADGFRDERGLAAAKVGGASTAEGRGLAVQLERAHQQALDHLGNDTRWAKALGSVPQELDKSTGENLMAASTRIAKRLEGAGIKNDIYAAAKRNLSSAEDEEVAGILKKAADSGLVDMPESAGPTTYTLRALQDKQSFYGALAENHRNPSTGAYDAYGAMFSDLRKAVQADMDAIFAQQGVPGHARESYQIAKAFSKEKMGLAELDVVRKLWKENPSGVLKDVVKAGDRKGTETLLQALGPGKAGLTQVRRHLFDEVFGAGGDAPIPSRDKMMAALSGYSENLKVLLTKEEREQWSQLAAKGDTPKFLQDQYDRRVKEILTANKNRALALRDPALKKLAQQEPHQLVQSVLQGDTGVVRAVKKYVTPGQFEKYQRYGMRDLLGDPDLPRRGAAYIKDKLADKPEFYKELLGEKNWAEMQKIGDAELLLPGFKDLRGSGASAAGARLGMAATFGVMGLILHPFGRRDVSTVAGLGLGLTIGPQALAELYLSDPGRKVVTTLLRLPESDPRSVYLVGRLAAAGYVQASQQLAEGNAR